MGRASDATQRTVLEQGAEVTIRAAIVVAAHLQWNSYNYMLNMNVLEQLMKEKDWTYYQLAVEYGKTEYPDLSPADLAKKYSTNIRKAVRNPEKARFETVKKLVELLGGELVIRVNRVDELPL